MSISRLKNEVRRNSADKAMAFHRSSLREKALTKNACRLKICGLSVISVKKSVSSVKSVADLKGNPMPSG